MKEYLSDLKFVIMILVIVIITILFNRSYLFSDKMVNQVKVIDISTFKDTEKSLFKK